MTPKQPKSHGLQKPQFLYHASSNRNIEEFEPRNRSARDSKEGLVVFATPDKACAACFLAGAPDLYVQMGRFTDREGASTPWHYICRDKEWFDLRDKGGAIYRLPSATFDCDPKKGLRDMEWTSRNAVRPIDKEEYESGLDVMLENGVNVYFVDQGIFDAIRESDDHGFGIIKGLQSYQKDPDRHGYN